MPMRITASRGLGLALPLLFALLLALAAACADATEEDDPRQNSAPGAGDPSELRAQIGALDGRVEAIEQRLATISAAVGARDLAQLSDEVALLEERIRALQGDPLLASLDAIDPLYCIDRSHPQYPSAEFDVYERGIPICGILPR